MEGADCCPEGQPPASGLKGGPPTAAGAEKGRSRRVRGGGNAKSQTIMLAVGIAILTVLVAGSAFALGYLLGDQRAAVTRLSERRPGLGNGEYLQGADGRLKGGSQGLNRRAPALQRVRELVRSGQAEVVRGTVGSASAERLTVRTDQGEVTVAMSAETRLLASGASGAGEALVGNLKQGQRVVVVARKTQGGNPEALLVRAPGEASTP